MLKIDTINLSVSKTQNHMYVRKKSTYSFSEIEPENLCCYTDI